MIKFSKLLSLFYCGILLVLNPLVLAQETESYSYGKVFYYTPVHKEKCVLIKDIPQDYMRVAVSPYLFFKGAICGACIRGEISFNKKKTKFNGVITNVYRGLYYGDVAINAKNIYSDAMWPIKWKFIKCPTPEPTTPKPTHKPTDPKPTIPKQTHKPTILPAGPKCKNSLMHLNGKVCCPLSCKECGNPGCESRPGGEKDCCYKGIIEFNNVSCEKNPAPCVINV